jgi:hypothetical protein
VGLSHFINFDFKVERGGAVLILGISGAEIRGLGSRTAGGGTFTAMAGEMLSGVACGEDGPLECNAVDSVEGNDGFGSGGTGFLMTGSARCGDAAVCGE